MAKLMIVIRDENFRLLSDEARDRGITIQELLRAVIVPDWVRSSNIWATQREAITPQRLPTTKKQNEPISIYSRKGS
jgi:hypothetical protein